MTELAAGEAALRTYEPLAPLYDRYTAVDDYARWSELLDTLLRQWGVPGRRLLDIACGTGKSSDAFATRGYMVTACDLSAAMLSVACAKDRETSIDFFTADMRHLPQDLPTFDVAVCMDDAINHLLSERDLLAAFTQVERILHAGGLYVFDVNTLATYRGWYAETHILEDDTTVFLWQGRARPDHPPGGLARADLTAFRATSHSAWHRLDAPHVQRHHSPALLHQLLVKAGLRPLATYGLYQSGRLTPRLDETKQTKAILLACRPSGAPDDQEEVMT